MFNNAIMIITMTKKDAIKKVVTERCSNFELLRIISMILIIVSHYSVHNGVPNTSLPLGFNRFTLEFANLGKIGVVIFMLISGYFLGKSQKSLKVSRLLKTVLQVFFYSVAIFVVFLLLHKTEPNFDNLQRTFLPITFKSYWFVTAYMMIYIFHPFINKFLSSLSRRSYLTFIYMGCFFFLIIRTITKQDLYMGEVGAFLLYYAIGNYLRVYKDNFFAKKKHSIIVLLATVAAVVLTIIAMDLIGNWRNNMKIGGSSSFLLTMNGSIAVLLIAVCIFALIGYAKEFSSKIINTVASVTFGIYLIHDNNLVRGVIWSDIFHNANFVNSKLLLPHMLGAVVATFVVCGVVEFIRKNTLERLYDACIATRIDALQDKLGKKMLRKVPEEEKCA